MMFSVLIEASFCFSAISPSWEMISNLRNETHLVKCRSWSSSCSSGDSPVQFRLFPYSVLLVLYWCLINSLLTYKLWLKNVIVKAIVTFPPKLPPPAMVQSCWGHQLKEEINIHDNLRDLMHDVADKDDESVVDATIHNFRDMHQLPVLRNGCGCLLCHMSPYHYFLNDHCLFALFTII